MSFTEAVGTLELRIMKYLKSLVNCLTFCTNEGRSCKKMTQINIRGGGGGGQKEGRLRGQE